MVLSCGTNFTGTLYCDKVTTFFFTCKGTFHSTTINREGCETSSAFCCSSPCAYEKARLRYFYRLDVAINIPETHRLRFTWEATAKGRRSLTSFAVDGGGMKCSLASKKKKARAASITAACILYRSNPPHWGGGAKKIRSHFVTVQCACEVRTA